MYISSKISFTALFDLCSPVFGIEDILDRLAKYMLWTDFISKRAACCSSHRVAVAFGLKTNSDTLECDLEAASRGSRALWPCLLPRYVIPMPRPSDQRAALNGVHIRNTKVNKNTVTRIALPVVPMASHVCRYGPMYNPSFAAPFPHHQSRGRTSRIYWSSITCKYFFACCFSRAVAGGKS